MVLCFSNTPFTVLFHSKIYNQPHGQDVSQVIKILQNLSITFSPAFGYCTLLTSGDSAYFSFLPTYSIHSYCFCSTKPVLQDNCSSSTSSMHSVQVLRLLQITSIHQSFCMIYCIGPSNAIYASFNPIVLLSACSVLNQHATNAASAKIKRYQVSYSWIASLYLFFMICNKSLVFFLFLKETLSIFYVLF